MNRKPARNTLRAGFFVPEGPTSSSNHHNSACRYYVDNHFWNNVKLAVFCALMPVEKFVGNEDGLLTAIPASHAGESPSNRMRTVHTLPFTGQPSE